MVTLQTLIIHFRLIIYAILQQLDRHSETSFIWLITVSMVVVKILLNCA